MKKYISFLLFITIVFPFVVYGQFDPKPQIQKPSADAESLGKFGEIPVDLYTGKVNINIPIYTIKYYDIEVPISISYHGGGIKVSDEAGSVGLGWTLNVGGVINRIMRGMPDNLMDIGNKVAGYERLKDLTLTNTLSNFQDFIDLIKQRNPERDPSALLFSMNNDDVNLKEMIFKYGDEYDNGHFDTAPDNYTFNLQGLSGAFIHYNNSLILQSNDGVRVDRVNNYSYKITDANGYIYQFQDAEIQPYFYKINYGWNMLDWDICPEHSFKYPSSWWLSSITSPTGEVVSFYYDDIKIIYPRSPFYGYTQYLKLNSNNTYSIQSSTFSNHKSFITKTDTTYKKVLNRIETPNSIVRFHYHNNLSSPFPYLSHVPHLDSIAVNARSSLNEAIETTKFTYTNTSAKAQLLKVIKSGANNNETQTHLFAYNSTTANHLITLNDSRIDHWGYFAPNSKGTFPRKVHLNIMPNLGTNPLYADRYANNATAANGMLSKIIYPTGGSTEFTWEPHSYSRLSEVGSRAEWDRVSEDEISYESKYEIEKTLSLCGKSANEVLLATHTISSSRTILLNLSMYYPVMDNLQGHDCPNHCITGWYDGDGFTQSTIGDRTHIRIKKDGRIIKIIHICAKTYQDTVVIEAAAGTYSFELCYPRDNFNTNCCQCELYYTDYFDRYGIDSSNYGYVKIQFGHQTQQYAGLEHNDVGGVRIKRITDKSANNTTALIKEYDYIKDPSDPQSGSSGVLVYPPRYASKTSRCETVRLIPDPEKYEGGAEALVTNCPDFLTLRSNGLPYTLNGGSHIEYSKVIESVVKTAGLAFDNPSQKPVQRTVYSYWTGADAGCSDIDDTNYHTMIASDMLQLTSQSYFRGHLKEKIEYTDEVKTTTYNYQILEQGTNDIITGSLFTVGDYTGYYGAVYGTIAYKDFGIVQYRVIPYNKRLLSATTEGSKSNDYQVYTYKNNAYSDVRTANAPASYSTINSEGETITQYFTYVSPNLNRLHTCVTVKNGKVIDAYRNEYDAQGRILKKYIALLDPTNLPSASNYNAVSLTNKLIESYIYDYNRLVQLTNHRSGVSTAFIWSYYGTYPIAEIQNATYSKVCNVLGNSNVNRLFNASIPNMNLLSNLRRSLPESMVSTMTYKMLTGITSFTDAGGKTTYFDYNSFGQLNECYIIENNQKKVVRKMEYHWSH